MVMNYSIRSLYNECKEALYRLEQRIDEFEKLARLEVPGLQDDVIIE